MTTPDPDEEQKALEEAAMLAFLESKAIFARDPFDFQDSDKDKIDDRVEGGGYSGDGGDK